MSHSGDEGGIAGTSPIVFDNGPLDTGEPVTTCTPNGTRSTLQNVTLCHDTLGSNATNEGATVFWIADDFTLAQCTDLQTIEFFLYETIAANPTAPTITSMNVQLHSAQPANPTSSIIQTATGATAQLTTIYRAAENATTAACQRRIQRVTVDVSAWPDLQAGSYWLSWQATGSASAGPWQPFVTILGQHGEAGGNGLQATGAAGAFLPLIEDGPTPPAACAGGGTLPPPTPQDAPFIIRGDSCGGNPCPGNIVTSGSSATQVDIDDLLAVIAAWGPCPAPPASCPANIATAGASATTVDIDDLLAVISAWGPCP